MSFSGDNSNQYLAARSLLENTFYPTPTAGFNNRLLSLLGITSYLFLITFTFLVLYYIALRKQNKSLWGWRLVSKFIIANIYIAPIVPNLITAVLLGALIQNTRGIYVDKAAQYHCFLWRNLTGAAIWFQGWISTYANVQAVLIISTKPNRSSKLPKIVNSIYLAVPICIGAGLLTFGILTSKSWDFVISQYEILFSLLSEAATLSDQFDSVSVSTLASINRQMELISVGMESRLEIFFEQYFILLILWSIASIILVIVNIAGVILIVRLHKQMRFQPISSARNSYQETTLPTTRPKLGLRTWSMAESFKGSEKANSIRKGSTTLSVATSNSGETPSALADNPTLRPFWTNVKRESIPVKPSNTRAMRKLERDLIIIITGVTLLSVIFSVDTILLACKERSLYANWNMAEVGLTLIIWAYVIVLSILVTALTINEIFFLLNSTFPTSTTTLPTSIITRSSHNEKESQHKDQEFIKERKLLTEGIQIQISSYRQISFDASSSPISPISQLNFESVPPKNFVAALGGYNPRGTLRSEWDKEIDPICKGRKASWASSISTTLESEWTVR